MRFAVLVFPGSSGDRDAYLAARSVLGQEARFVWHEEEGLGEADVVIVPGGATYGDYLRSGALAARSPMLREVARFAEEGGLVLGICNGFQVLCEAGLLPGALLRNASLRFVSREAFVRVENAETPFTRGMEAGQVLALPIAHGAGNYYADEETLAELEEAGRVVFRYSTASGELTAEANPNGSAHHIAGIVSEGGNVLGLMPHPERCTAARQGRSDGALLFRSILEHVREAVAA